MPFTQLLQSLRGQCRHCGQQAGVLQRNHQECQEAHGAGWQEMASLATKATMTHTFNEAALRQSLAAIANRSHATGEDIERSLEEGFAQGVAQAMADGIITRDEEQRLCAFRDRLALENSAADQGALAELDRAGTDRVLMEARPATISVQDGDGHLQTWTSPSGRQAWETAALEPWRPEGAQRIRLSRKHAGNPA